MPTDPSYWITQGLNGLQLSMLLFLLSIGLTVIFGLLHFVNLAHGALYAFGAYVGLSVATATGSFWIALMAGPLAVTLLGMVLYATLVRRMRHAGPMNQVLVTFGLIFIFLDVIAIGWGKIPTSLAAPEALAHRVEIAGIQYPAYRLFVIGLGLAVMTGLWLVLSRTQIGAMIRAGVENEAMAACLGIHVERLFFWVFCLSCALAGLAGVVAAPILSVKLEMANEILIPTLIVVVIGGLGSLRGAIAGSLVVGFVKTLGPALELSRIPILPEGLRDALAAANIAGFIEYVLLAGVLILRPQGLFPARA